MDMGMDMFNPRMRNPFGNDFFKDDLGSPTNATFMLANGFAYYTEN